MLVNIERRNATSPEAHAPARPLRMAFINMPFAAADRPSIQCGLLASLQRQSGHETCTHHFNLSFARCVGAPLYAELSDNRWLTFLGEWCFAYEAFQVSGDEAAYFDECRISECLPRLGLTVEQVLDLRNRVVPEFLDECMAQEDWADIDVVGFTCTFDQQVPSFALARRLKEKHPRLRTIFGGATFDRENATEFVRKLSYVDYFLIGEADESVVQLASALANGGAPGAIAGLVGREPDRESTWREPEIYRGMNDLPDPDYGEYFRMLERFGRNAVSVRSPRLPFQSARGCWWGAKHHCTFCSLRDSEMTYRSRDVENVVSELVRQSSRYKKLQFTAVDAILDLKYIDTLFPMLGKLGMDATFFYEMKANLTREQLWKLARGGVRHVQPGIESLSTPLLGIMKKGTTKLLNVRFLKWARYYGITAHWNIIVGFPEEHTDYYDEQSTLIPQLSHLQPPSSSGRLLLEKFGPYILQKHPWFQHCRPLASYRHLFPESIFDVDRIALYFEARPQYRDGIEEAWARLESAISGWQASWEGTTKPMLAYERGSDWSRVVDTRTPKHPREHCLNHLETAVLEACGDTAVTAAHVARNVADRETIDVDPAAVEEICKDLLSRRLLVEEDGRYLSLPLPMNKQWQ